MNAKKAAENYRMSKVANTWVEIYKFLINELYPLRFYRRTRKERVELVKEFVKKVPQISF